MKRSRIGVSAALAFLPLAAVLFIITAALPAYAQETAQAAIPSAASASTLCAITSADLGMVTAAAAQGLLAELAARQALLTKTITCAKLDAETLQANLNSIALPDGDASAKTIQSQLSGKLDDAITYYNLELGKVSGTGVAGTQAIAREVLSWRSANYDPLAAQVGNFTLWASNQALFTTGTSRLHSIEGIVKFIEQAAQNAELQSDLGTAQSLMQAARDQNASAERALLQQLPPGETLTIIQQSLQSLSNAYQKFFDISTIVQKLLPATPADGAGQ